MCVCVCVCTQLCPTLCNSMDCSPQAPLFMEISRQEYWSGLLVPSPGALPDQGMNLCLLCLWVLVGGFFTTAPRVYIKQEDTEIT